MKWILVLRFINLATLFNIRKWLQFFGVNLQIIYKEFRKVLYKE